MSVINQLVQHEAAGVTERVATTASSLTSSPRPKHEQQK
ncbi:hypothetical protein PC121_g19643 [Phytophthora cactorum]|nr:hypothetical protein PC120_g21077 [Phytophthora cactorum]KAG3048162.1 hypothetical protein PC121_g19643 [Phytophthora cactorum]KAG4043947.1 hypothetical protein PC123_g20596 [Phytophthora cactorum]